MVSLSACGLLLGSLAVGCSDEDAKAPAGGGSATASDGGSPAGGQPASTAGEPAIDGTAGLAGAGIGGGGAGTGGGAAGSGEDGAVSGAGGASAGAGGATGDGGADGESDLQVSPASGWYRHSSAVNDSPGAPEDQSLALDLRGNGNAVLVWSQSNGTSADIMARHYSAGVWKDSQIIDGLSGNAEQPHVTMDGQGNAMAIWRQMDEHDRYRIFYAQYVAKTATWSSPTPHEVGPPPYNASHPRVAADVAGNVLATWNAEYGTNDVVTGTRVVASFYKGAAPSPSWTIPEPISSPGSPQRCGRPRVALSSAGYGFVVWDDQDGSDQDTRRVYGAKYTPNSGFSGIRRLNQNYNAEEPARTEDVPDLVMDDAGNAIVVWRQVGVSGRAGVALSWFMPQLNQWAAQPDLCEGRETVGAAIGAPAAALNDSGEFAVSFWESPLGKQELVVMHGGFDDLGSFGFGAPKTVLMSTAAGSDPRLALRKDGTAILAWTQRLKNADSLLVGQSSPSGEPSVGTLQLDLDKGAARPQLAVYPGTDLALLTYVEGSDIRSATTAAE